MGYCLLERRTTQRLIARSSPPFNRQLDEPSLSEVMGNDLGLSRALWIVAQQFGGTAVQRLPSGFEQTVVGGVLD